MVLFSGGVDSATVCLRFVEECRQVTPLFVNYGQVAAPAEWSAVQAVSAALGTQSPIAVSVPDMGRGVHSALLAPGPAAVDLAQAAADEHLPYRNSVLAMIAAIHAATRGIPTIGLGIVGGAGRCYPDTTPGFLDALNTFLAQLGPVSAEAPFVAVDKHRVVHFGWKRGFDYGLTWSCNRSADRPCGSCAGCIERVQAFQLFPQRDRCRWTEGT